MRVTIAELEIELLIDHPFTDRYFAPYRSQKTGKADITIPVTLQDVAKEKELYPKEKPIEPPIESDTVTEAEKTAYLQRKAMLESGYYATVFILRKLAEKLYAFDAFLMHACAVCVDGKAVLFCAQSGTGKTTHSRMWEKRFGERFFYINGDKPILRKINGVWRVFGTPWAGKEGYGRNTSAPLYAICLLKRGKENEIQPISKSTAFFGLMNQILHPEAEEEAMRSLDLLEDAMAQSKNFQLHCNLDPDAARVASEAILS